MRMPWKSERSGTRSAHGEAVRSRGSRSQPHRSGNREQGSGEDGRQRGRRETASPSLRRNIVVDGEAKRRLRSMRHVFTPHLNSEDRFQGRRSRSPAEGRCSVAGSEVGSGGQRHAGVILPRVRGEPQENVADALRDPLGSHPRPPVSFPTSSARASNVMRYSSQSSGAVLRDGRPCIIDQVANGRPQLFRLWIPVACHHLALSCRSEEALRNRTNSFSIRLRTVR